MRKDMNERSKLVLPRLAGEKNEGASIEEHHTHCEEVRNRMRMRERFSLGSFSAAVRYVSRQVNIEMAGALAR